MSFHGQRLRQLRQAAGLDPTPISIYLDRSVHGFVESIDPRFYSPEARHWYDQICAYVAQGEVMPRRERAAFLMVGSVLNMARDERDQKVRNEFLMPSARGQRDFNSARRHRDVEFLKSIWLEEEMWKRGYRYGPDYNLPEGVIVPSADGIFDRKIAREFGLTAGAVKQQRLRWRAGHNRVVRRAV